MKFKIETQSIELAITEFEKNVDFELVPVVTPKSSFTEHIGWMISLILLLMFLATIDLFFQDSWAAKTNYYIAAPFLAVAVDRFFISKRERARQVFEKAQRIFFLKHLHELKRNNSIILFISIMERQIVILPDPRLKLEGLDVIQKTMLQLIQNEFKKGHFEAGFLKAIGYLQAELVTKFPKNKQISENEVPNKLIWWND
jgi:uncharacterized membrane protein